MIDRTLQQIEFSIMEGRGGNHIARDVSGVGGVPLSFNHQNMRLNIAERTKRLSELPLQQRHKGVVVAVYDDNKGGLIIPDRMNYSAVFFHPSELQTTGNERIERFAEVEFFVEPSFNRDKALCITRPGGQVYTSEKKEMGSRRRQLGAQYAPNDVNARIPQEFLTQRQKGYVASYDPSRLFGNKKTIHSQKKQSVAKNKINLPKYKK